MYIFYYDIRGQRIEDRVCVYGFYKIIKINFVFWVVNRLLYSYILGENIGLQFVFLGFYWF